MAARAVLFDVGNVVVRWDPRALYSKIFPDPDQRDWFLGHVCTMAWHGEHDRGVSMADNAAPLIAVDNPEATLALKELSSAIWKLSPHSREALILIGAGGFSYEEAARLCDCSIGTLKARVSRARKLLSEQMR